ncbi:MAG: hypothetical protein JO340_00320 [Acidobacteriaceae bacterium]|nr:hypothetical protein [Acidobacteriaceae bacterium]
MTVGPIANAIRPGMLGAFLLTLVAGQTPPARPEDLARPVITVHIYNVASTGTPDIRQLELSATRIFNKAGIEMVWVNCSNVCAESTTLSRFGGPSDENVVQLRIVDQLDRGGEHVLGWTTPDSTNITVQYNRARMMARVSTSGVSPGEILGHLAAHEIGHIILGTPIHSPFGVMKSTYSGGDLLKMVQGNLAFTAQESRTLRARLGSVSARDAVKQAAVRSEVTCAEQTLRVRIYNKAQIPAASLDPAATETARLFRAAGIHIGWEHLAGRIAGR